MTDYFITLPYIILPGLSLPAFLLLHPLTAVIPVSLAAFTLTVSVFSFLFIQAGNKQINILYLSLQFMVNVFTVAPPTLLSLAICFFFSFRL